MKVAAAQGDRFANTPPKELQAALVYGPDEGLVRERLGHMLAHYLGAERDPFRFVELTGKSLEEDPARLHDEASQIALGGGLRVVLVRAAGDGLATSLGRLLEAGLDGAIVLLEAGDLPPRSRLRKLFETADNRAAALACYPDEGAGLRRFLADTLEAEELSVERDALAYLVTHCGSDRQITRRELEKLVLYLGPHEKTVSLAAVEAVVGDSAAVELPALFFAITGGNLAGVERSLQRLLAEGMTAVGLLRALSHEFERLYLLSLTLAEGEAQEKALARLRPPVFWKAKEPLLAAARRLPPPRIAQALAALLEVEAAAKKTGTPAELLLSRTLLRLAVRK